MTALTKIVVAGAIIGACASGIAVPAYALPCDAPIDSCGGPAAPAPVFQPGVPPVMNPDGTPGSYGQGSPIGDIFQGFQNGVPSDILGPVLPENGYPGQRLPGQRPPPPGATLEPPPPPLLLPVEP